MDVCEAKCCRVRQKALFAVEERMKEHYANLRRFGGEILRSNKNNTVKIKTTRLQDYKREMNLGFKECIFVTTL